MIPDQQGPATPSTADKFDDEQYPAYTMGSSPTSPRTGCSSAGTASPASARARAGRSTSTGSAPRRNGMPQAP